MNLYTKNHGLFSYLIMYVCYVCMIITYSIVLYCITRGASGTITTLIITISISITRRVQGMVVVIDAPTPPRVNLENCSFTNYSCAHII